MDTKGAKEGKFKTANHQSQIKTARNATNVHENISRSSSKCCRSAVISPISVISG